MKRKDFLSTMLDQSDYIARYDREDVLGVIAGQHAQLAQVYPEIDVSGYGAISQIVLAGMGGSALAGEFVRSWLIDRLPVPFEVMRGYDLPAFAGADTLVIVSSYSGNTEESLSCLAQAKKRGCEILVLTAGGKLQEIAAAENYPAYILPGGLQPRLAVFYSVRALSNLLEALGFTSGLVAQLESSAKWLLGEQETWLPTSPTAHNHAKKLAEALVGHPVVVYAGSAMAVAALKWKINFNETSKNLAFYYLWPEFNHNEFMGWSHPTDSGFKVIELRSDLDHPQVQKRFEISNRLLSGTMPAPIQIHADGATRLRQMLWTQLLGDFVSAYLGLLNGIDPTPVRLVEKLKKELA